VSAKHACALQQAEHTTRPSASANPTPWSDSGLPLDGPVMTTSGSKTHSSPTAVPKKRVRCQNCASGVTIATTTCKSLALPIWLREPSQRRERFWRCLIVLELLLTKQAQRRFVSHRVSTWSNATSRRSKRSNVTTGVDNHEKSPRSAKRKATRQQNFYPMFSTLGAQVIGESLESVRTSAPPNRLSCAWCLTRL
jgi:hypothetical protein